MKSITIHKLDDSLETLLIERAKSEGQSLNKTINIVRRFFYESICSGFISLVA